MLVYITEFRKPGVETQPDEENGVLAGLWVQESIPLWSQMQGSIHCCSRYRFYSAPCSWQCCCLCKASSSRALLPVRHGGTWLSAAATLPAVRALLSSGRDWGWLKGKELISPHQREKPESVRHLGIWEAGGEKYPLLCCRLFTAWEFNPPTAAGLGSLLGAGLCPTVDEGFHWWLGQRYCPICCSAESPASNEAVWV